MAEYPPTMIVCVGSVVLKEDTVLFVRQTYGETLKGKWSIPWGYVQGDTPETFNDPPHIAAVRETLEEAGVVAIVDGLLGIQNASMSSEGIPRIYLLFLCRHISGMPTPDGDETDQAAYYSLGELQTNQTEFDPFCYWLAERVLKGEYTLILPNADNPYSPHLAFL